MRWRAFKLGSKARQCILETQQSIGGKLKEERMWREREQSREVATGVIEFAVRALGRGRPGAQWSTAETPGDQKAKACMLRAQTC